MAEPILRLGLYESRDVIPLGTRPAATYEQKIFVEGNSLLATVYLHSADPGTTVSVSWYDYGVGASEGEEMLLVEHLTLSAADTFSKILITKHHNKPLVRAVVTGGNARFGLYVTVVVSQANDIDAALKLEGQPANFVTDKGIPIAVLDRSDNTWHFLTGEDGVIPVAASESGDPLELSGDVDVTLGVATTLMSTVVPLTESWKVNQINVVSRAHASWRLERNAGLIASGRTGPHSPESSFAALRRILFNPGDTLELKYYAPSGQYTHPLEAYIRGSIDTV